MSYLDKLKNTNNRKELAVLLGYKPSALTSILYKTPFSEKYTTFEIPKKSGGTRIIKSPNAKLKKLQTHLAHLLYACLAEIEEERKANPVSYGFRKKGTITANARNHKRRRYVLNLDIQDFFPSFNFGRVRGFFLKDQAFELNEEVATTIAQIACDGVALPQGSPCSPIISELIGQILDLRLLRLSKKYGMRYSRYADDLTFSTNQKNFPMEIAVQDYHDKSKWILSAEIINKIKKCGFTINPIKTRMHVRGSRQMVTGLVVNEKVNVKSEYYRKARAMCDSLFTTRSYYHCYTVPIDPNKEPNPDFTTNTNPLEGILSHIYAVTQSEDRRSSQEQRNNPRAIRILYRRFLFYKYCMAPKLPLIITEGKTDPIYLHEAIVHRSAHHPLLGKQSNGKFEFAVRFFNYGGQAHEIMDLGGGTGDLKSILIDYLKNLSPNKKRKPFSHVPMRYPIILLLDNDDGLKNIAGTLKKNYGISVTIASSEDFYFITENLYIVKTPEANGQSCIEDLFPSEWKTKRLRGKKFNANSKIDPETEYGKEVFAKSVIKPNANRIDFSGFDPLLKRIVAVINHYQAPS